MTETSTKARVVIADDEAIIRLDLKEILLEAGYDVVGEAGNGNDAKALIIELKPELAILDIKMPGIDGIEVARSVTSDQQVAILLLTAFSQRDLIEQARLAGVAAYLVKPFRRNELLPAIAGVLGKAREEWAIDAESATGPIADDKLESRRLVEAAKVILIDEVGLDEEHAFTFIQRTAMTTRSRIREVAEQVIAGTLRP